MKNLTKRENEMITLMASRALSKKEIADQLFVSIFTVEKTLQNAYKKLGATKSLEVVAWWWCENFNLPRERNPLHVN